MSSANGQQKVVPGNTTAPGNSEQNVQSATGATAPQQAQIPNQIQSNTQAPPQQQVQVKAQLQPQPQPQPQQPAQIPAATQPQTVQNNTQGQPNTLPGNYPAGTPVAVGSHKVEVIKYIAEGGFAQIYTVKFIERLNEFASLPGGNQNQKPLQPGDIACLKRVLVNDDNGLNEMRNEVNVMQKLQGAPCVVQYYDSNASHRSDSAPGYEVLLLMEFCPNNSLLDYMNDRLATRLSEKEIMKIMYDTTLGIAQLHYLKTPLIHRDIKIENVLVDQENNFKLCDFGSTSICFPIVTNHRDIAIFTQNIYVNTTPQYRSPEMIDLYRYQPIDEKSDIWALGVFLYKLLFFTTPFERTGQFAILHSKYEFPKNNYSSKLINLIIIMLAENPSVRPNIYQVLQYLCSINGWKVPLNDKYGLGPYNFTEYAKFQGNVQNIQNQIFSLLQKSTLNKGVLNIQDEIQLRNLYTTSFEVSPKIPVLSQHTTQLPQPVIQPPPPQQQRPQTTSPISDLPTSGPNNLNKELRETSPNKGDPAYQLQQTQQNLAQTPQAPQAHLPEGNIMSPPSSQMNSVKFNNPIIPYHALNMSNVSISSPGSNAARLNALPKLNKPPMSTKEFMSEFPAISSPTMRESEQQIFKNKHPELSSPTMGPLSASMNPSMSQNSNLNYQDPLANEQTRLKQHKSNNPFPKMGVPSIQNTNLPPPQMIPPQHSAQPPSRHSIGSSSSPVLAKVASQLSLQQPSATSNYSMQNNHYNNPVSPQIHPTDISHNFKHERNVSAQFNGNAMTSPQLQSQPQIQKPTLPDPRLTVRTEINNGHVTPVPPPPLTNAPDIPASSPLVESMKHNQSQPFSASNAAPTFKQEVSDLAASKTKEKGPVIPAKRPNTRNHSQKIGNKSSGELMHFLKDDTTSEDISHLSEFVKNRIIEDASKTNLNGSSDLSYYGVDTENPRQHSPFSSDSSNSKLGHQQDNISHESIELDLQKIRTGHANGMDIGGKRAVFQTGSHSYRQRAGNEAFLQNQSSGSESSRSTSNSSSESYLQNGPFTTDEDPSTLDQQVRNINLDRAH
ncbi:hypothetical protein TBLA_0E02590 [Henningerozyma blattae CBS 6284]|uniref:Protein kinase domain-containing protein n=1 Tax=Henningerozyma blattae (strain ATCC 34711 / CBS 6284 / DSM 70876 / NBRC 10599 / NRRL Y-10934 / UCD 77-7) TaxID=1071380 RepID=I2H4L3_HENB6|nr:hypothetical protein TBLA_0E02590 [Tetrapisispora blattae CBS 6284]CCH61315.1 hypothetical protein TBLA_0E02590 [Tetrapisispora blattae CBS 6284]